MSEPVRIAVVAEGPTDGIVLHAIFRSLLGAQAFVLNQLQPEGSLAFGELGAGWAGVYRWCKQAVRRGNGRIADDALLFQGHDVLVIHLDADVASGEYADGAITPEADDLPLPCEQECPPAEATTNALRAVLLSWCGEDVEPSRTLLCVPSKSTETWVVASLYPSDRAVVAAVPFECHADPESRLQQQPKRVRIRKSVRDYREKAEGIQTAWSRIAAAGGLGEAKRFDADARVVLEDAVQ